MPLMTRRTLLRGAGAALALPLLDATKLSAAPAAAPTRFAALFFPNGVWRKGWIPEKDGADYELPFSMTPLAPLKRDVLILSGLDKANSKDGDGHYAKTANFLTGHKVTKTTGRDISVGGVSADQYAAAKVGKFTPLPSLELGTDPVISGIDSNVGYTRLYGSYVSWRGAGQPVAKEINPRFVYVRLFAAAPGGRGGDDRALLDLVLEDARDLRKKLGRDDQIKVDEYLDAVRSVESRIEFGEKPDGRTWKPESAPPGQAAPAGVPREYRDHVKVMLDLMVLAFWTDATRVSTFMFANDVSGRNFSFVDGVKGGHHDISHHSNDARKIDQYQRINRWHVEQYAYLLGKLKSVKEGEATLLDNSMILMGCGMGDGNNHDHNNLPIVLGGRGGGALNTGRHVSSPKGTPLCNVYVSVLERMGAPVQAFGDSSGPLSAIHAG